MTKPTRPLWNQKVLTEQLVIEIFALKSSAGMSNQPFQLSATEVSRQYNVNEKAIRDIWAGRTWTKVTTRFDRSVVASEKQMGRPRGSKDKQPRKRADMKV